MHLHHKIIALRNGAEQDFLIIYIEQEFSFEGIVHINGSPDVHMSCLVHEVGLERDWDSFPSLRVRVSQSVPNAPDDSFSYHMRFLLQMVVVGIWVVEGPAGLTCQES